MTADVPTTRAISDEAKRLLEYALHLRMYGECAPGGHETWAQFDTDVEHHLRGLPRPEPLVHECKRAQSSDEAVGQGSWVCGRCGAAPESHGDLNHPASSCIYDPALAQSSGRGADHALAEQIAQAIEAHLISIESDWQDGMRYAAAIARTFADEVTGR